MSSAVMNHLILDLITDHRVARVLDMLQCLATKTPRIVLGRVEETFPFLRHNVVSVPMAFEVLLQQVAYQ
jgi:hypothetical protein